MHGLEVQQVRVVQVAVAVPPAEHHQPLAPHLEYISTGIPVQKGFKRRFNGF